MTTAAPAGAAITEPARAKLNLYLHVTGRRADGYHELDSLIAFADVHDTVIARPAETLTLAIEGPMAGALEAEPDNLVLRAARALAAAAGIEPATALTLVKELPVASGIGGGSADAAAALRALARLWGTELSERDMMALALELGADVPVCLAGRTAWLGGIGERLDPGPALPEVPLVLVNPMKGVSTPAVFKARKGGFDAADRFDEAPQDAAALAGLLAERRNGLTEAALSLLPEVAEVLDALAGTDGAMLARMSGSGATCFALFGDAGDADRAADAIAAAHPAWWTRAGRMATGD